MGEKASGSYAPQRLHNPLVRNRTSLLEEGKMTTPACTTCNGVPPASGIPCICGGVNTIYAEVRGLREAHFDLLMRCDRLTDAIKNALEEFEQTD